MNTSERTAVTRDDLMAAFIDLYGRKKIERITIKEITDLAGYNRGTFYVYFKDVYDILEQAEALMLSHLDKAISLLVTVKQNVFPEAFFKTMMEVLKENQQLASVLMSRGSIEYYHTIKKMIKEKLMNIREDLSPEDKRMLELTVEYQVSAVIGVLSYWVQSDLSESVEDLLTFVMDISRNGVLGIVGRYTG